MVEPSQSPWVRGPMIGTLPSCNWPHKNVHVREWLTELVSGNRRASWDDGVAPVDNELSIRQIGKPVAI
jgi:hypothetical protein